MDDLVVRRHCDKRDKVQTVAVALTKTQLDNLLKLQKLLTLKYYGVHSKNQFNFSATMRFALDEWAMPKLRELFPELPVVEGEAEPSNVDGKFFNIGGSQDIPNVDGKV